MFNEKTSYEIIFKFMKEAFIALLSFIVSLAAKCTSLNNELYLVRPTFINLNPKELYHYPLMISLKRWNESCYSLDDSCARICSPNKTEVINLNVLDLTNRKNESKIFEKKKSFDCKCELDDSKFNSNQM